MPGDVRRRWDSRRGVARGQAAVEQMQRHDLRRRAQPDRLRARHLVADPRAARRKARGASPRISRIRSSTAPTTSACTPSGAIYFSDPWYGRMPVYGVERPRQLGFQGVYRVPPGGGAPKLVVDRHLFDQPNGLCFSPDERLLYVNDTVQALIRVFDVKADGTLAQCARVRQRHPLRTGARPARRHEVRPARQCLGDRARRRAGSTRRPASCSARSVCPRLVANLALGWPGFPHALSDRDPFGLCDPGKVGPAPRALMSSRAARAGPDTSPPRRAALIGGRRHAASIRGAAR